MTATSLHLSNARSARIVEIFSSLQGEGLRLGERQIFVRFGGCNLCCDYCDEPETIPIPSGELWNRERIKRKILILSHERPHRSVSWTGGEPLLHAPMLEELMPWVRGLGLKNYLETNGTLPEALRRIAGLCDVVAMDIKLPSATGRELWSSHLDFLRVAPEKTFVKVVLTAASTASEWDQVIRLIKEVKPQVPLILQPATLVANSRGTGGRVRPIPPRRSMVFLSQTHGILNDVRLIPQWHPVWGLP
jgi:organic radical activating enzyme